MSDMAQTHPGEMFERPALEVFALSSASALRGSWYFISALVAGLLAFAILTTCHGRVWAADGKAGTQTTTLSSPAPQLP
jgi:hypothetical protein